MKMLVFAAVIISSYAFTSCAELKQPQVGGVSTTANTAATAIEQDVLALVNDYRRQKGLAPLKFNAAILAESRQHSKNMATKTVPFSHDGFNDRAKRLGTKIPGMKSVAENVAYGQQTAREVVQDWLKSPGHKMNIEGNYTQTGIGVIANSQGVLYYTQMFVR